MENSTKSSKAPIPSVTTDIPAMDIKIADCKEELLESATDDGDAEPERGTWTGRFDFLLSLLGYSVGLGNVWRFPYLCYNNGGGAFLIPFTVMLIIAGLPLMFMELSFGQYAALGPVAVYNKFCPLFQGLGYGMVIVSSIVMLYYNLIIAWTIYYMTVSFMSIFYTLPWQNCNAEWSTKHCYSYEEADRCESKNGTYYLRQCYNQSYSKMHNITALAEVALRKPPAEEYFTNQVLGLSSGIEETGQIRLGMAACLFAAWLIVFLCLCKGVQSSGKVVYFTALFPYVVLVILFFRGVTLPGASTGILFYLTPDFSQLANAQVWGDAAVQIFFALSPAWGGLITLSSYNKFTNNCYIDSLIVAVSNIATSFFAGLVIFSVIGFLAHELNVEVDRVVDQGAGLAFIVYPEVVTRLPVSPLWSILFFVMLLTLGLDSQFALMETVTTAILDRFPNFRQKKIWVVLTVAVFGYLGGLIFTTNSGMYWLQLMDKYAANWSVLIIAIGECILIAWIYGAEKFCGDIQRMIGNQSKLWVFFWTAMWKLITPAALVFILIFNWIEYKPASYGHYVYPMWADAVGWTIGVLPVVVVVLMAVDQICSGPDELTIMEASQDGGDSTSITSGVENEMKKTGAAINKPKKNSIKRKLPSFSNESDDAVIEPLLQKDKEEIEAPNQSAKYNILMSKIKTDANSEMGSDKDKLIADERTQKSSTALNAITLPMTTEIATTKSPITLPRIHNHMNANVFSSHDGFKGFVAPKSQILVEIDGTKQVGYNPSPLIFTTAKIHTDGKTKHMEPVQVTPVPILSTTEVSALKSGGIINNKDIAGVSTNVTTMFVNASKNKTHASVDRGRPKSSSVATNNISTTTLLNKSVDMKTPNAIAKTSISPVDAIDAKKYEPIFTTNNVKTVPLDPKQSYTGGKSINDSKKNKDESQTKISQSQLLENKKVVTPVGHIKSVVTAPSQTIKENIKQNNKDGNNILNTHEDTTTNDKSGIMEKQAPNIDLNKNIKLASEVADLLRSEVSDNNKPVANIKNDSDAITEEKVLKNMDSSSNNKQLQRQKVVIMSDSNDSTPKVNLMVNMPALSNDTTLSKNTGTSIISAANITSQTKSPVSEVSSLNAKTNPLSKLNNQTAISSKPTPIISNTLSTSKLSASDTSTLNKTSTATSILQTKPNTALSEHSKNKSLTTKNSPNNTISSSGSVIKPETSKAIAKPQITSGDRTSALSSTTASIKTTNAPTAAAPVVNKTPQSTTTAVSVANSVANLQSSVGKSTESTAKPSTIKNNPTSTNSIITQAAANVTSTAAPTASIMNNGGTSQDRDTKDKKSLKA